MAYTDDWESLMNGVFGAGGRVKFGSGAAQPDTKAKTGGLPDLNAALLEQQKQLDELLKKQNAQLKKQDADTQMALENSRQMLRDMENDGLLAKGTADTKPEHLGSFEGLAAEVKKTVLGQDAFVDGVVRAMRRPFVLGTEAPVARNVILLSGAPGTGRHFALEETARIMAARGLLQSDKTAVLDLAEHQSLIPTNECAEQDSVAHPVYEAFAQADHLAFQPQENQMAVALVERGLGIAVLPGLALRDCLPGRQVQLLPLKEGYVREIGLLCPRETERSPLANAFLRMTQEQVELWKQEHDTPLL